MPVSREDHTKHLGVYLDSRLNISKYIRDREAVVKATKRLILLIQYKAALIVSRYWQGTSRGKLYDELGWESLSQRRWSRRLTMYYKITNGMTHSYLSDHLPGNSTINLSLRNKIIRPPRSRTERYDNSFSPFCTNNWNKLDDAIKSRIQIQSL